jgi:protein phosphatase 1L
MLHGVRFLLSAAAAFARLAHAVATTGWALFFMPLCSPTSTTTAAVVHAPWQHLPPRSSKVHVHPAPAAALAVGGNDGNKADHVHLPLQAVSSPPPPAAAVVVPVPNKQHGDSRAAEKTAKAAARGRPPRLAIPPPVACAPGVDPFGAAADWETDVATEVEVQGEGFCLASRRGVRHAMEDGYGVITDHIVEGGSQLVSTFHHLRLSSCLNDGKLN